MEDFFIAVENHKDTAFAIAIFIYVLLLIISETLKDKWNSK